jgi:hypothetical protein
VVSVDYREESIHSLSLTNDLLAVIGGVAASEAAPVDALEDAHHSIGVLRAEAHAIPIPGTHLSGGLCRRVRCTHTGG